MKSSNSSNVLWRIKTLLKHSGIFGFFDSLGRAIAIILIPLYTHYLVPKEYGALEILLVTGSLLPILFSMGFGSSLVKYYIGARDEKGQEQYFNTAFFTVLCAGLVLTSLLLLLSAWASNTLFGTASYSIFLQIIVAGMLFEALSTVLLALFRAQLATVKYSIISLSKFTLILVLNIYFIVFRSKGIEGILLSNALGSLFSFSAAAMVSRKSFHFGYSIQKLKEMLSFGLPLVLGTYSSMILSVSDRYFLQHYSTLVEVGYYSLSYKVGMIMSLIVNAFVFAWTPTQFMIAKDPDAKETYSKILLYFILTTCTIFVALSLFAKEIVRAISPPVYQPAYVIIPFILMSYIFNGMYFIFGVGLSLENKTKFVPVVVGGAAIVNLVLNVMLIPHYGMMGAAIATVVSYVIMAVLMFFFSQRYYRIEFDWNKILGALLLSTAAAYAGVQMTFYPLYLRIVAKLLLVIAVPALMIKLGFIEQRELAAGKSFLSSTLSRKSAS